MPYYLGIDGGGTKTKVAVCDAHQNLIYINESGPSSIDTVSLNESLSHIEQALEDFYKNFPRATFTSVFAGLGGITNAFDYQHVEAALDQLKGVTPSTIKMARNDMENALSSGLCYDEGMVLICGTGMVCYGKDRFGSMYKSGGWGFKEGDAGSGYDLGLKALKHTYKAFDGRLPKDQFSLEVAAMVGLKEAHQIFDISKKYFDLRTEVAKIAPLVTQHADLGNKYAIAMIERATDELSLAVSAVYQKLKLTDKKLVIVGGLGNSKGAFRNKLHKKIKMIDEKIDIIKPVIDPAHAASIMAIRNAKKSA